MATKVEGGGRNRAPLLLVILLVAQLLLMSSQARGQAREHSMLRGWLLTATFPIQKALGGAGSFFYNGWYGYFNLVGAREENTRLRTENEKMSQELFQLREKLAATERSTQLLRAQEAIPFKSIAAHVIARDGSVWFNQVIIDRGSLEGVKLNQAVITPGGIVGRVIGVGPKSAQVQLITDGYAGVGAQLADSRAYGEVKGMGKNTCEMRNVSGLETVKEGEPIITTGFDGIYPKGLLVGYVEQLVLGGGAKNHQITVRPAAGLDRLEEVLVLQLTEQDLRIDETVK